MEMNERPAGPPRPSAATLDELPREHRRGAEVEHLARPHDVVERLQRLLDRRGGLAGYAVGMAVDHQLVDVVVAQAPERRIDRFQHVLADRPPWSRRAHRHRDLGGQHVLVAWEQLAQQAADDLLAGADAVDVGAVEGEHPPLDRPGDDRAGVLGIECPVTLVARGRGCRSSSCPGTGPTPVARSDPAGRLRARHTPPPATLSGCVSRLETQHDGPRDAKAQTVEPLGDPMLDETLEAFWAAALSSADGAGYFPALYPGVTRRVIDGGPAGSLDAVRMGSFVEGFTARSWTAGHDPADASASSASRVRRRRRRRPVDRPATFLGINAHVNFDQRGTGDDRLPSLPQGNAGLRWEIVDAEEEGECISTTSRRRPGSWARTDA